MAPRRQPLIAGNWKMHHGGGSGCTLARDIVTGCGDLAAVDVVVAPPFTALAAVAHEVQGSRVTVAAQNVHPEPKGAYTGEVSPGMLLESGCSWVIIGHSERRQLFGESDDFIQQKVQAAIEAGLRPIACVGETLEEREAGRTLDVVFRQLDAFINHFANKPGFGVLAYEPVWAIGTGKVATAEQAQEVHAELRGRLAGRSYDQDTAQAVRVQYGGSVTPANVAEFMSHADIDGALVGGASLKPDFVELVRIAAQVKGR